MELEVSRKVRDAIKAKLLELGCHVDDELPDYIMVLIANRRSTVQMESDLALFLNENNKKFVSWLTQVLKKLEQVTATSTLEEKAITPAEASIGPPEKEEVVKPKKLLKKTIMKVKNKDGKVTIRKKQKPAISSVTKAKKEEPKQNNNDVEGELLEILPSHDISLQKEKTEEEPVEKSTSQPKVTLAFGKKKIQAVPSAIFEPEEEEATKQHLYMLSEDEDKSLEDYLKSSCHISEEDEDLLLASQTMDLEEKELASSFTPEEKLIVSENISAPQDSSCTLQIEQHVQSDELILVPDENEFELDELRRIALESQEKKRQDKQSLQTKTNVFKPIVMSPVKKTLDKQVIQPKANVIKPIVMSPLKKGDQTKADRRSRSIERFKISRKRETRSPKKTTVFSRLDRKDQDHHRTPRSAKSTSPQSKRLNSTIGNVIIRRSDEYSQSADFIRPSISSVITVTKRPKQDPSMTANLIVKAFSDMQRFNMQSDQHVPADDKEDKKRIVEVSREHIRSDQHVPVDDRSEKRGRGNEGRERTQSINKRRFNELPDRISENLHELTEEPARKRSVKERLGVRRDQGVRKSIKERLGIGNNHQNDLMEQEPIEYYNDCNILINFDGGVTSQSVGKRNVTLANPNTTINRISIPVNNSEEDDTSEDDSTSGSENETKDVVTTDRGQLKNGFADDSGSENFEQLTMSIDNDDKLPEVPSDKSESEYIEELIEIDEKLLKGSLLKYREKQSKSDETPDTIKDSSGNSNKEIVLNDENQALMNVLAPTIVFPPPMETDVRTRLSNPWVQPKVPQVPKACSNIWNCRFKQSCKFLHPTCKYGNYCTKGDQCPYRHEKIIACKFFPECPDTMCKFFHPKTCERSQGCSIPQCKKYHPGETRGQQRWKMSGGTVLPKVNELRWTKK